MAITDFLKTKRSKAQLRIALAVVREFKSHENTVEWMMIAFDAWVKLEQLEEFLAHLVDGEPLASDTLKYVKMIRNEGARLKGVLMDTKEAGRRGGLARAKRMPKAKRVASARKASLAAKAKRDAKKKLR